MTTLAAFQGDGWAVIGCDSRASDDGGRAVNLATPKVVQNGEYLIAVSGSSRGGNIAQFGWIPPVAPKTTNVSTLDKFISKRFIPSLRKAYVDSGYDAKDDGEAAWQDSNLLVAVRGIIYPIFNDYSWDRDVRNIYCAGSGGDVALGAMVALGIEGLSKKPEQAEHVVQQAVVLACNWDVYTSAPVITMVQHGRK